MALFGRSVRDDPGRGQGAVYVGGGEERVAYALDAGNGEERWQIELDGRVWGAPTVVDDTVYVGTRGGRVYALSAGDGHVLWNAYIGHEVRASVAATDDAVYVPADGTFTSLDSEGNRRWSVELRGETFAPTVAGDAIVVTDDESAICLDAADGNVRWRHDGRQRQISDVVYFGIMSAPVVEDGVAYVASHGGDVCAVGE